MPDYIVTSPNGQKYRVTAPDGATQEQILSYAQQQFAQPSTNTAPPSAMDRANAVGSGFNSAVAAVAGLPVDTMQNLIDLSKAAMGTRVKNFGADIPSWLQVPENQKPIGGSAWFRDLMGSAAQLPRPEVASQRYLAAAGGALPATMMANPASAGQATTGLITNLAGNLSAQGAADLTRNQDNTTRVLATAGAGLLGSNLVARGMERLAQPMHPTLTPGEQATIATADAEGIPVDAAQRTGSTFLRRMRNVASDNPFTAGGQKAFTDEQKIAINRALLRTIGEDAPRATPEVMGRANDRIGNTLDAIAQRNPAQFDTNLASDIQQAQRLLARTVPESMRGPINTNIADIMEAARTNNGVIPGEIYQRTRSALQTLSRTPELSPVATDLREALDNALTRSVNNPADIPLLQNARLQWRNMRTIEGAIAKDNSGNISPAIVSNTLGTSAMGNRNRSVYGRGDQVLPDIAKAGREILSQDPNSGTPLRLTGQSAPAMIGGAAMSTLTGHYLPAAALAVGGYGFPRIMQAINNSPAVGQYLSQGLPNGPVRNSLMFSQTPGSLTASPLSLLLMEEEARRRGLLSGYAN